MSDEQQGFVLLFPENFPDWALTEEERREKRRLRLVGDDGRDDDGDDDAYASGG
jgi:hypothetical protein